MWYPLLHLKRRTPLLHLKWLAICALSLPAVPPWNRHIEPICSPNTINKVPAAHQYCYLHSVLIPSPYNHKMLIAPINSQSVCALVWPPGALKVTAKMNQLFDSTQGKKLFPRQRCSPTKKSKTVPSFIIIIIPVEQRLMGLKSCDLICPFKWGFRSCSLTADFLSPSLQIPGFCMPKSTITTS